MSSKGAKPRAAAIKTSVVTITPKMAFEWLKKNTRNRPPSPMVVERYAEQMKSGEWTLTGDPIRFSDVGVLLDGQHRLAACVLADKPFQSVVVRGVTPDAFNDIDQGYKRTLAHMFARDRKPHYVALAAAAGFVWRYRNGMRKQAIGIDEGYRVLMSCKSLQRCVGIARAFPRAICPLTMPIISALMALTVEIHGEKCIEFWWAVGTSEGLKPGSPQYVLYRRLREVACDETISRDAAPALAIKAFNAWIGGAATLRGLKYDPAVESFPEIAGR